MELQFQYKEFAWLLVAVPALIILFFFLLQWKKKVKKRMGDERLVKLLIAGFSPTRFTSKFVLLSVAFTLGAIAAMNPRKPGTRDNVSRKGIDLVIALDVSKSMLAADLPPNRLERAKQLIFKLMNEMPDDRIGLVVFAGKAYLQMPITSDHGAAQLFVSSANPDAVPQQGTIISDALRMSAQAYNMNERRFKAVLLISDGEDHDPQGVKTAEVLAEQGVMINTVGVGSPDGSTIIDPATGEIKKDESGNPVISKLNEEELKQIAGKTNGIYLRLEGSDEAVIALKKQLSQIEAKAFGDMSLMNYRTWFMWFAAIMFVILVTEQLIPEKKNRA